jgi:hypothetical protein
MIHIYTYAHKRPDFIRLQYESIKKHIKSDYKYVVFNNSIDSKENYDEIHNICRELQVECVDIPKDSEVINMTNRLGSMTHGYPNPNVACSYPIIWTFKKYVTDEKRVCIIDSDMFFIKDINFDDLMGDKEVVAIPQYRANHTIKYYWNAFICVDLGKNPLLKELDWNFGSVHGTETDVGGFMNDFLIENYFDTTYIHEYSIYESIQSNNKNQIHFIMNGNINYDMILNEQNDLEYFRHSGGDQYSPNRSFPHEENHDDYSKFIKGKTLQILELFEKSGAEFPHPQHIAFIGHIDNSDFFICHYKSGSNYLGFSTNEYNLKKTEALKKVLGITNGL